MARFLILPGLKLLRASLPCWDLDRCTSPLTAGVLLTGPTTSNKTSMSSEKIGHESPTATSGLAFAQFLEPKARVLCGLPGLRAMRRPSTLKRASLHNVKEMPITKLTSMLTEGSIAITKEWCNFLMHIPSEKTFLRKSLHFSKRTLTALYCLKHTSETNKPP